jgi:hypothetical protein
MADGTWLDALESEDIAFMRRFLLASGSLKDLAGEYGVSYPTIRLRLDRIIAKVNAYEGAEKLSPFERMVRLMIADGKIDTSTAGRLLESYRAERSTGKTSK